MPWEELEETYAPQFSPTTGAPAKSVRLSFGALFIKQRLGLTDEETVEQIRDNAYMQFFLGFAGYSSKAPFDPSMMVHFRKRFSEEDLGWMPAVLPVARCATRAADADVRARWDARPHWWHLRKGDQQHLPQMGPRPCLSHQAHARSRRVCPPATCDSARFE